LDEAQVKTREPGEILIARANQDQRRPASITSTAFDAAILSQRISECMVHTDRAVGFVAPDKDLVDPV
jgi:hypothetical protein